MPTLIDTPEFAAAKDALQKAVRAFEDARLDVLIQLRAFAEEVRRLEAPTADDIEAMAKPLPKAQPPSEAQTPKPQPEAQSAASTDEPFVTGLPPEALRKVWPEWEDEAGGVVTFKEGKYHWAHWHSSTPVRRNNGDGWSEISLRPHGATRAHVEALAQQAQTPKPHACPRCDEGMREIEITRDLTWASPRGDYKAQEGQRLRVEAVDEVDLVLPGGWCLLLCGGSYRFTHPSVPPRSEWCDGSGKGGAE